MSASPPLHRRATRAAYRGNRPGRESVHRANRTRVSAKRLDRCACSSPPKRSDQCSGITRRDHEATGFILVHSQHLGNRPDSGADDRLAGSHGFQNDIGETFGICGQDEEIRGLHASPRHFRRQITQELNPSIWPHNSQQLFLISCTALTCQPQTPTLRTQLLPSLH